VHQVCGTYNAFLIVVEVGVVMCPNKVIDQEIASELQSLDQTQTADYDSPGYYPFGRWMSRSLVISKEDVTRLISIFENLPMMRFLFDFKMLVIVYDLICFLIAMAGTLLHIGLSIPFMLLGVYIITSVVFCFTAPKERVGLGNVVQICAHAASIHVVAAHFVESGLWSWISLIWACYVVTKTAREVHQHQM
jgi:hypothetical protein